MKLSVSLRPEDVAVLDRYVKSAGLRSRSAALQHAIGLLRHPDLEREYAEAWQEWRGTDDAALWEGTVADGLTDASR